MKISFEKLEYSMEDNPDDLFSFCLENKLFKQESDDFKSRMKNVFLKTKGYHGVSAVIAYDEKEPIGICLLEHRLKNDSNVFYQQAGITHFDNRQRKNPWKKQLNFYFLHMGFIAFYVKESHRKQGIAKNLLHEMESLQLKRLLKANLPKEVISVLGESYMTVTAREKAEDIVRQSILFHPIKCDIDNGAFNSDISSLSYKIHYGEMTDKKLDDFLLNFNVNNKKQKKKLS